MTLGRRGRRTEGPVSAEERVRRQYEEFKALLASNNECLALMAGLQEDFRFVPPLPEVVGDRVAAVFDRTVASVEALEKVTGKGYASFHRLAERGRREVEAYLGAVGLQERPPMAVSLAQVDATQAHLVGGKAASLGEVANHVGLPVPEGFVLTAGAYAETVGVPLWREIRDVLRDLDPDDEPALAAAARRLQAAVESLPLPRAVEVAITERARTLGTRCRGFAVRSSAVGEGGQRTFAGQFLSLLNVPEAEVPRAYLRVLASRFSERALAYRLSQGITEVESPMAVLVLPTLEARAAGILYTQDPGRPAPGHLLIAATSGLGLDVAGGVAPADLYVVARTRSHAVLEHRTADKTERVVAVAGGGIARTVVPEDERRRATLSTEDIQVLAPWGVRLEAHFASPQDVEWVLDDRGEFYVVQTRALAVGRGASRRAWSSPKATPLFAGGRTVFPGRTSGPAMSEVETPQASHVPEGTILLVRRPTPEIVKVLPRLAGLVAERGNITGHAAALLREYRIPSVFEAEGALQKVTSGTTVSLDATRRSLYEGTLWPPAARSVEIPERFTAGGTDPLHRRLLTLNLVDPSALNFRPSSCRSAHDVLRFCHEKAIEAMFSLSDSVLDRAPHAARRLAGATPIRLYVLDLGGGLAQGAGAAGDVRSEEIVSRPFQALWRGVTQPGVSWRREMPASIGGLASVMAGSLGSQSSARRALGEKSYLLVASEYMNLNSRLAFHFTLVDATLTDARNNNAVSFRFAGGGATRWRRNLRAVFLERILRHLGFQVDRRVDVVNAWFRKGTAAETEAALDHLGRLMACSSQLDMYMESHDTMEWYVEQFMRGNYAFTTDRRPPATGEPTGPTV
ncbi:MAG: hypothetical protein EPN53_10495 [Acidobacteria bacterium]|nr:MAG: hypothetical protein EPN53_10495 [Acidobacteriota bacterium]